MRESIIRIATAVNQSADGEGSVVASRGKSKSEASERARLFLNVTALVGTGTPTMTVSIVHVIDGVDIVVGAFPTSPEGLSSESIVIEACPAEIKAKWVESGTVTDFDATVDCMRF